MKLKVVGDGTKNGTKVVDENGNSVEGITDLSWSADGNMAIRLQGDSPSIVEREPFQKKAIKKGKGRG